MKALLLILALVLTVVPLQAKRSKFPRKFFPATHASVFLENDAADSLGFPRIQNQQELDALVLQGAFIPFTRVNVSGRLPRNRRYALPQVVQYVEQMNEEFMRAFGHSLVVNSAVRPGTVQKRLRRWNRNAAPASGERASTHERGTTVDISRHMSRKEYLWVVWKLMVDRALGRVLVIEEKECFHIFVKQEEL